MFERGKLPHRYFCGAREANLDRVQLCLIMVETNTKHHCVRLKFGDFCMSSPKFFPRGWGGPPTFGGRRPPKVGYRAPKARCLRKFLKI